MIIGVKINGRGNSSAMKGISSRRGIVVRKGKWEIISKVRGDRMKIVGIERENIGRKPIIVIMMWR
jgi:hypothetical protein